MKRALNNAEAEIERLKIANERLRNALGEIACSSLIRRLTAIEMVDLAREVLETEQTDNGMDSMHPSTFEYLRPTDDQVRKMTNCRAAATEYAQLLDVELPEGSDKIYIMRKLREVAMWVNVALTRQPDGAPRSDAQ